MADTDDTGNMLACRAMAMPENAHATSDAFAGERSRRVRS